MQTDSDMDLIDFFTPLSVFDQGELHTDAGSYGPYGILKTGEDGITERFNDASAFGFNDWKENTVVAIDHRHVLDIALFLRIGSRALDVAEKYGHRRSQLLEFLLRLGTRFQQFLKSV